MRLWRPGSLEARTVIKVGLWSGLLTWMVCTLVFSVLLAMRFYYLGPGLFGYGLRGDILGRWIGPIWIVFTTIMLVWAVARFTVRRFRTRRFPAETGGDRVNGKRS